MTTAAAPRFGATVESIEPAGRSWRIRWRVRASGRGPLRIREAHAPHGRFRAARRVPRGDQVELLVRCPDPENGPIENAFLVMTIDRAKARWRVLVRMRVGFARAGTPRPRVEAVSAQRANFSGLEER